MNPRYIINSQIDAYGSQCYRDGYKDGLRVADNIRLLLTSQPDTTRLARLRGYAEGIMLEAEEKLRS